MPESLLENHFAVQQDAGIEDEVGTEIRDLKDRLSALEENFAGESAQAFEVE